MILFVYIDRNEFGEFVLTFSDPVINKEYRYFDSDKANLMQEIDKALKVAKKYQYTEYHLFDTTK